jgi:hypothetical protein
MGAVVLDDRGNGSTTVSVTGAMVSTTAWRSGAMVSTIGAMVSTTVSAGRGDRLDDRRDRSGDGLDDGRDVGA